MPTIPTELTVGLLINLAAIIVSLCCTYIPGFQETFASWTSSKKMLFQLIIITSLVVIAAVLSFTGIWLLVSPDKTGVIALVVMWGSALWTNQTTYSMSPEPKPVTVAKAGRS